MAKANTKTRRPDAPPKDVRQRCNVRIRTEAYDLLENIVGQVTQFGWSVLGRESAEVPTLESVASYAIQRLSEQAKKRPRG